MRLTVFNGSPRGKNGNSTLLMARFLEGFESGGGVVQGIHYLKHIEKTEEHTAAFRGAEHMILILPLYTDAMPGIVKFFLETLEPFPAGSDTPSLSFIIQSGFPEPAHSRFVARYLEKLAKRLGCRHSGTVVRGGVEGIRVMPPWMTRKLFRNFLFLGRGYAETGSFDARIARRLAPREHLSFGRRLLFRLMKITGAADMYWNMQLKKHGAFERRFARPYHNI